MAFIVVSNGLERGEADGLRWRSAVRVEPYILTP